MRSIDSRYLYNFIYFNNPAVTRLLEQERVGKGNYVINKPWYENDEKPAPGADDYNEMEDELAADNKRDDSDNIIYLWKVFPDRYQEHPDWLDEDWIGGNYL